MIIRRSLAQKTWARWEKIRDKFSEGQWRLLLLCFVVGFLAAFAVSRKEEPPKTAKVEQQTKVVEQKAEKKEAPQIVEKAEPEEAPQDSPPLWPAEGQIVREMGWYRSEGGDWRYHTGIDIATPLGGGVEAAISGKIVEVGQEPILGQFMKTEKDGTVIVYGHLSAVTGKVGDTVTQGQVIAYSGESGECPRPAVHLGVFQGGQAIGPGAWFETGR